ncbi:MAG: hypothetical protein HC836_46180 [Richelia sp. RM2_1_2]|nr:hypothetical protein [Richelia sp. RM2_1_2]
MLKHRVKIQLSHAYTDSLPDYPHRPYCEITNWIHKNIGDEFSPRRKNKLYPLWRILHQESGWRAAGYTMILEFAEEDDAMYTALTWIGITAD